MLWFWNKMKSTRWAYVERYVRSSVTKGNLYGINRKLTEFNIHVLSRCKLHRLLPVVCVASYGYDRQHNNKAEYLQVKTKSDIDMNFTYLI
jgi:hypothetical protein